MLVIIQFSNCSVSAKSSTQILHSTHQPRGDARRQRQPDMCGGGLAHASRQVDEWRGGPDQGRRDASGSQRAGGHQHPGVSQLHLRGHILSGHDRSHSPGHCQRWELMRFMLIDTLDWFESSTDSDKKLSNGLQNFLCKLAAPVQFSFWMFVRFFLQWCQSQGLYVCVFTFLVSPEFLLLVQPNPEQDFFRDQNVTVNAH